MLIENIDPLKATEIFSKVSSSLKNSSQAQGHIYLAIDSKNNLSSSKLKKESASFKQITNLVKIIMSDEYSTLLTKKIILNSYEQIKNKYKEKKLGFFTRIFYNFYKTNLIKNAENLIKTELSKLTELSKITDEAVNEAVKESKNIVLQANLAVDKANEKIDNAFQTIDKANAQMAVAAKAYKKAISAEKNGETKIVYPHEKGLPVQLKGKFDKDLLLLGKKKSLNGSVSQGEFKENELIFGTVRNRDKSKMLGKFENELLSLGMIEKPRITRFLGQFSFDFLKLGLMFDLKNEMRFYGDFETKSDENNETGSSAIVNLVCGNKMKLDETEWIGIFKDGHLQQGTKILPNGTLFEGQFDSSEKLIHGKKTLPDGTQLEGKFSNEKLHGPGQITYPNGEILKGNFDEGLLDLSTHIY